MSDTLKIKKIRTETAPEDFKKRGVTQGPVEVWEDGRRDDDRVGAYEWWYFDFIMDDGTKVVIHFHTKPVTQGPSPVALPQPGIKITLPDGTEYEDEERLTADVLRFGKGKCDVTFGPHHVTGDLREYLLHFEPVNGVGADLKLTSTSKSWRPGTAFHEFGEEQYFTWLCAVPRGRVTGTLTFNGKTVEIAGYGYHDHQWSNVAPLTAFNHWYWCRQNLGDYTMLVFDITAGREFGYQHIPMVFVEDNDGNVIFECTDPNKRSCRVLEEYRQEATGKDYPRITEFTFEDGGKKLEFTLKVLQEIHMIDSYSMMSEPVRKQLDQMGIQPTYARLSANGAMRLTGAGAPIERSGELIYEFVYMAKSYKETL